MWKKKKVIMKEGKEEGRKEREREEGRQKGRKRLTILFGYSNSSYL